MELRISPQELRARRGRVLAQLAEKDLAGMILFSPTSIFYLTGFVFIPTERPLAVILLGDGRVVGFVPRLESEHLLGTADAEAVRTYPDYPGETHPMLLFGRYLKDLGLAGQAIAADAPGYGSGWGYTGPSLEEVFKEEAPGTTLTLLPRLVEEHRMVKSEREVALIRESARWGNLALSLLQEYSKPGLTETDISRRATGGATEAMIRALGPGFEPKGGMIGLGAFADFRGQVGPNSALPHAICKNLRLKLGDVLGTGSCAPVWGYDSELERTMFVGPPSREQRQFFDLMREMQEAAFSAIRPGRPCSDVDQATRAVVDKHGLGDYWRHHTGHALGVVAHEAPFFDVGDHTILRPGMVFSVEPGLYVPGLGGFRHSDTVVVTESGVDLITYYPRDLESLICG
ncbi:MAG TPA: Xaa-Pro peptidase family protein [Bacillota bacterium]|jgi:Xaa-Pro aminopeptidase